MGEKVVRYGPNAQPGRFRSISRSLSADNRIADHGEGCDPSRADHDCRRTWEELLTTVVEFEPGYTRTTKWEACGPRGLCDCHSRKSVVGNVGSASLDCRAHLLTTMPAMPPSMSTYWMSSGISEVSVNFAVNEISDVPHTQFDNFEMGTGKFTSLAIIENQLTKCPHVNAPDLKQLFLQINKITMIEPGALDRLDSLEELHLGSNQVTCVLDGVFPTTRPLTRFQFNNNPVGAVSPAALEALVPEVLYFRDHQWDNYNFPDASSCHVRDVLPPPTFTDASPDPIKAWRCCCATGFTGADGNETASRDCSDPSEFPSVGCVPTFPALSCRKTLEDEITRQHTEGLTNTTVGNVELACDLLPTAATANASETQTWSPAKSALGVQCSARVVATQRPIPGSWQCTAADATSAAVVVGVLVMADADLDIAPVYWNGTVYGGNTDAAPDGSGTDSAGAAIGGAVAGVLVLFVGVIVLLDRRKTAQQHAQESEFAALIAAEAWTTVIARFAKLLGKDADRDDLRAAWKALNCTRKDVSIGEEMGGGGFGARHFATLSRSTGKLSTIAKVCEYDSTTGDNQRQKLKHFMTEAYLLAALKHPNILEIVGVVAGSLPMVTLTVNMQNGDLMTYLRSCRPIRGKGRKEVLDIQALLRVGASVVTACQFLEGMKVVHRALMARNVLVGKDHREIKLTGMDSLRDVFGTDEYVKTSKAKDSQIHIQWLAPECIQDLTFSGKSDVWSFGVLLWEVFSFGKAPFGAFKATEIAREIAAGRRLDRTDNCPPKCSTKCQSVG